MYFSGYDRCKNSGTYKELLFATGINVWENAGPNRGKVVRQAKHGERAVVLSTRVVQSGPGGTWYRIEGGGWANDLWLTPEVINISNLEKYALDGC